MRTWLPQTARTVRDASGVQWRVTEMPARGDRDPPGEPYLIADSANACRRVVAYPAHWRDLPDAELLAVIELRCPTGPR